MSLRNKRYTGADGRESLYDLTLPKNWNNRLIIFLHGYMGYKDWGCWELMEHYFTDKNYGFLKYNVSHNGGTVTNPIDFDDLDAFSNNTYSKEIEDFDSIVAIVESKFPASELYLIGHSRGGGVALLQSRNPLVKKIATLAAISSIALRFPSGEELEKWRSETFSYRKNGRTGQEMPTHINLYDDYLKNRERLDIQKYCQTNTLPNCIIHGSDDVSVQPSEGIEICNWLGTELIILKGEAHTFGSSQPWIAKELSLGLKNACDHMLTLFDSTI